MSAWPSAAVRMRGPGIAATGLPWWRIRAWVALAFAVVSVAAFASLVAFLSFIQLGHMPVFEAGGLVAGFAVAWAGQGGREAPSARTLGLGCGFAVVLNGVLALGLVIVLGAELGLIVGLGLSAAALGGVGLLFGLLLAGCSRWSRHLHDRASHDGSERLHLAVGLALSAAGTRWFLVRASWADLGAAMAVGVTVAGLVLLALASVRSLQRLRWLAALRRDELPGFRIVAASPSGPEPPDGLPLPWIFERRAVWDQVLVAFPEGDTAYRAVPVPLAALHRGGRARRVLLVRAIVGVLGIAATVTVLATESRVSRQGHRLDFSGMPVMVMEAVPRPGSS